MILLCTAFLAYAGIIRTEYESPTSQVIYDQPESSPIYESANTQEQNYDTEYGASQSFSKSVDLGDFKINEFQITPSFSGPSNIQAVSQFGSSQGSISPSLYTTSAALPKPVSLPSYSIGSSKIIYNSKVTPGLSAYASSWVDVAATFTKTEKNTKRLID